MRRQGRIETVPKKGSFVTELSLPFVITLNYTDLGDENAPGRGHGGGEGSAFMAEAKRQKHEASTSKPDVYVQDAEELQMKALGIPPAPADDPRPQVVRRSQQRFVDGKGHRLQARRQQDSVHRRRGG